MKKFNVKVDWRTEEGEYLLHNIGLSPNGHITFTRTGDDRSTLEPQIVIKIKRGELAYNEEPTTERIVKT